MADFSKYEKIKIGDKATLKKKITKDDVQKFVQMTGDNNPLHVNAEYAEHTPFKGIVVHGMLGASFISTIIGTQLPGEGALWVSQSFDFLLPVRLGDELVIEGTVIKKHDRDQMIELETTIRNQTKALVLTGFGKVKILATQDLREPISKKVKPQVAIVTGATGGIGREICRALAKDGFKVALFYRNNEDRAAHLADEIKTLNTEAMICKVDLNDESAIRSAVNDVVTKFGGVGVLVNNASPRIAPAKFFDLSWESFQEQLDVQVKAAFILTQLCAEKMKDTGGSIINISSQVIDGQPSPSWTAYATAKAALSALTRYAAAELGPQGIRVNQVAPGMTETSLVGDVPEKTRLIIARQTPLRRLADPVDVAHAVAFLASEKSAHMTGETMRVNGGAIML